MSPSSPRAVQSRQGTRRRAGAKPLAGVLIVAGALLLAGITGCDFTARVGGLYESKNQVMVGAAGDQHETKLVLVLGQYGAEVSGHLEMPSHPTCPCVYVQGDFGGDALTFESEPSRSPNCDVLLTGAMDLSADRLTGRLYGGTGTKPEDAITGDLELVRLGTQSDLGSEELRGCRE
jgi:hypothetical protein